MMMMAVSVFAMILLGIASLYAAGMMQEGAKDSRRVVAEQMMIYHAAAARYCSVSCPDGPITPANVQGQMASFRKDAGPFAAMNRRMRSMVLTAPVPPSPSNPTAPTVTAHFVVTYLSDPNTPGMSQSLGELGAEVRGGNIGDTGIWNGIYRSSTGKIAVAGGKKYWRNDAGGLEDVAEPIALSPGAGTIPDGSPVVVSRI